MVTLCTNVLSLQILRSVDQISTLCDSPPPGAQSSPTERALNDPKLAALLLVSERSLDPVVIIEKKYSLINTREDFSEMCSPGLHENTCSDALFFTFETEGPSNIQSK